MNFLEVKNIDISQIQSYYDDNLKAIDEEIELTEEFYTELKTQFDRIMHSTSSGALTFISKQTPNLITLRKNKIDLLKEKNAVLKNIIDSTVRLSVEEEDSSKDNAILKELHKMLLSNSPETYRTEDVEELDEEEANEDMDALLENRFNEIQKNKKEKETKKSAKEMKSKKSRMNYKIVLDIEGNMYAVDDDYNIIEDDEDIEYPDWEVTIEEDEDGTITATNQYNEEIEIIEFDDEDE